VYLPGFKNSLGSAEAPPPDDSPTTEHLYPPAPPPPALSCDPAAPPAITKYSTRPGPDAVNVKVPTDEKVCIRYPPAVVITPPVEFAKEGLFDFFNALEIPEVDKLRSVISIRTFL
jgi:hypothetical protein